MSSALDEKLTGTKSAVDSTRPVPSIGEGDVVSSDSGEHEVFRIDEGAVDFRTVTWQRLIIILLKVQIATGVLSIPSALGSLGAVPGALIIVGWQALNTCKSCS